MQCSTVVEAVVKASSGDRSHVKEYMGIVCGEVELSGWHQERCSELALSVFNAMSDDLCFHFVRVSVAAGESPAAPSAHGQRRRWYTAAPLAHGQLPASN